MPEKVEVSTTEGTALFTKEVTAVETPKEVKKSNEKVKSDDSNIKHDQKIVVDKGEATEYEKMLLAYGFPPFPYPIPPGMDPSMHMYMLTTDPVYKAKYDKDRLDNKKAFKEQIDRDNREKDIKYVSNEAEEDKTKKMDLIEGEVKKVEAESKPNQQSEAKTSEEESKKNEEAKEAIKKWMTSASMQGWRTKQNEVILTREAESKPAEKTSKKISLKRSKRLRRNLCKPR